MDIRRGLHWDTGGVMGRGVRASHTITFIGLKPGLLTLDGPDHCGAITVNDLGLPAGEARAWVAGPELFRHALKPRPPNFPKGIARSPRLPRGPARQNRAPGVARPPAFA